MAEPMAAQEQARATGRNRVLWAATVLTQDGSHSVRVRDLSRTGAQVLSERELPAGSDAIFRHGGEFVAARIAWSNAAEAGIQFYRELQLTAGPATPQA
jgi:hypothetical protein